MANTITGGRYYTTMTVDTAPGAAGALTGEVYESVAREDHRLTFSVRGATGTVTLQFKEFGDSGWTDEGNYESGDIKIINSRSHRRLWRCICKQGAFGGTGDLIFGFGW